MTFLISNSIVKHRQRPVEPDSLMLSYLLLASIVSSIKGLGVTNMYHWCFAVCAIAQKQLPSVFSDRLWFDHELANLKDTRVLLISHEQINTTTNIHAYSNIACKHVHTRVVIHTLQIRVYKQACAQRSTCIFMHARLCVCNHTHWPFQTIPIRFSLTTLVC